MFDKIPAPTSNQMGPGLDQNGGPRPVSIKGPRLLKELLLNPGPFYYRRPPRKAFRRRRTARAGGWSTPGPLPGVSSVRSLLFPGVVQCFPGWLSRFRSVRIAPRFLLFFTGCSMVSRLACSLPVPLLFKCFSWFRVFSHSDCTYFQVVSAAGPARQ